MSEDLIKRSDAIDVLYHYQESVEMGIQSFSLAVKAMYDIPTIEPKRGRWIPVDNGHHVRCSECGRCGFASNNFCPNCGADMRGTDDE